MTDTKEEGTKKEVDILKRFLSIPQHRMWHDFLDDDGWKSWNWHMLVCDLCRRIIALEEQVARLDRQGARCLSVITSDREL